MYEMIGAECKLSGVTALLLFECYNSKKISGEK
jgi:hypothetical protein